MHVIQRNLISLLQYQPHCLLFTHTVSDLYQLVKKQGGGGGLLWRSSEEDLVDRTAALKRGKKSIYLEPNSVQTPFCVPQWSIFAWNVLTPLGPSSVDLLWRSHRKRRKATIIQNWRNSTERWLWRPCYYLGCLLPTEQEGELHEWHDVPEDAA